MRLINYRDAGSFLKRTRTALEVREEENGLMLGLCLRLNQSTRPVKQAPYFAAVEDAEGLAGAAMMTPPYKLIVYTDREDCDAAMEVIAANLREQDWPVPGILGLPHAVEALARAWQSVSGARARESMRQRFYVLTQVRQSASPGGTLRVAAEADIDWVVRWARRFHEEVFGEAHLEDALEVVTRRIQAGDIYVWEDGRPVSIAARSRPTPNGMTVNLVYTPPKYRRQGYATACVAAVSHRQLDSGKRFCTLSADLANPTSNSIYQKIGYRPVCDFSEYVFGDV